jgi:hypothetical protein
MSAKTEGSIRHQSPNRRPNTCSDIRIEGGEGEGASGLALEAAERAGGAADRVGAGEVAARVAEEEVERLPERHAARPPLPVSTSVPPRSRAPTGRSSEPY